MNNILTALALLVCRPMNRRSLTSQLRAMTKQPSKPTKNGVLAFLTGAGKFALQGAVVYLAVTALQGKHGQERLKEDFHAVAVRFSLFAICLVLARGSKIFRCSKGVEKFPTVSVVFPACQEFLPQVLAMHPSQLLLWQLLPQKQSFFGSFSRR